MDGVTGAYTWDLTVVSCISCIWVGAFGVARICILSFYSKYYNLDRLKNCWCWEHKSTKEGFSSAALVGPLRNISGEIGWRGGLYTTGFRAVHKLLGACPKIMMDLGVLRNYIVWLSYLPVELAKSLMARLVLYGITIHQSIGSIQLFCLLVHPS